MTQQEKLIVSAYTGFLMTDMSEFHTFIEKLLGRPIFTHELAGKTIWKEISDKIKPQFLALCKD